MRICVVVRVVVLLRNGFLRNFLLGFGLVRDLLTILAPNQRALEVSAKSSRHASSSHRVAHVTFLNMIGAL